MQHLLFPDDTQFWFETVRLFSHAAYGGSDVGEVLAAASRITPDDDVSWHDAYRDLADRLYREAETARPLTRRDLLLRASTYYFTAQFFLHGDPDDPRINAAYDRSVECFRTAAALLRPAVVPVEIPYEGVVLEGYLYRSPEPGLRPAVIMHSGFDGSAEELHFMGAQAAAERGYHVLTFDGPGQPSAVRRRGLTFRPDWENVVGPVIDLLEADRAVDPRRIALVGVSLGGLLAPRAAAFEPRVAAVVALDGVFDALQVALEQMPWGRPELERRVADRHDEAFERWARGARARSHLMRWACDHGRYAFGARTDREFAAAYLPFTLAGGVAERITCPTLVCEAAEDLFFAGEGRSEPRRLFDHLTCPRTLLTFTAAEGGDAHCQAGAMRLAAGRVFDWLDATLGCATAPR